MPQPRSPLAATLPRLAATCSDRPCCACAWRSCAAQCHVRTHVWRDRVRSHAEGDDWPVRVARRAQYELPPCIRAASASAHAWTLPDAWHVRARLLRRAAIGAAFTLPKQLASLFSTTGIVEDKYATETAQMISPIAMQIPCSPVHLLARASSSGLHSGYTHARVHGSPVRALVRSAPLQCAGRDAVAAHPGRLGHAAADDGRPHVPHGARVWHRRRHEHLTRASWA